MYSEFDPLNLRKSLKKLYKKEKYKRTMYLRYKINLDGLTYS